MIKNETQEWLVGTWDGLWEHKKLEKEAGGPLFQAHLLTLCLFLASGGGSLIGRGGPIMVCRPSAHSCHPRGGSCPAPEAFGQEVSSLTATLLLGAGSACAGVGLSWGEGIALAAPRAPSHRCLV